MKVTKEEEVVKTLSAEIKISIKELALESYRSVASDEFIEDDFEYVMQNVEDYMPYGYNVTFQNPTELNEFVTELCTLFSEHNERLFQSVESQFFSNKESILETLELYSKMDTEFGVPNDAIVEMIIKNWNK